MTQADRVYSTPPTNAPADPTRRRFLSQSAGVAAGGTVLALAIPPALAMAGDDPIFAVIETHKKLRAEWLALCDQLDEAEDDAAEEHGRRPIELIHWRNYHIGAGEIEIRRQTLLEVGEIDPATVEQEYLDANARYQAKVAAGQAWDERTGLATLCEEVDHRSAAERQHAERLARTKPATPAGVAALIQYVLDDHVTADESCWHVTALRTAVAALNNMGAVVNLSA